MSGSVFSGTLQEITNTKLEELSKRRAAFEEDHSAVLASINTISDPVERLKLISQGVTRCFAIKTDKRGAVTDPENGGDLSLQLYNANRLVAQTLHDPCYSKKIISDLAENLLRHLTVQSQKLRFATLYGQLVKEWLAGDQEKKKKKKPQAKGSPGDASDDAADDAVDLGSAARVKMQEEWERNVFEHADVDEAGLRRYLDELFGTSNDVDNAGDIVAQEKQRARERLKQDIELLEHDFSQSGVFNNANLEKTMEGLIASELMSNEQREVLQDFKGNSVILNEIADVLNMRMAALETWSWSPNGVAIEQHRKINGAFSVRMRPDLLQAIFLQYIGVRWSVRLRKTFTRWRRSKPWTSLIKNLPPEEQQRLEYYLGHATPRDTIQAARKRLYVTDYFVSKLLRSVDVVRHTPDGQAEAEYGSFNEPIAAAAAAAASAPQRKFKRNRPGAIAARKTKRDDSGDDDDLGFGIFSSGESDDSSDNDGNGEASKTPFGAKQQLLHLLATEIAVNKRLHGELTAFHGVFSDPETSLPHETILTILEYFGVSQKWLGFFTKFLQAPIQVDEASPSSVRVQKRGVPASHILSDVFEETVLFCLDYAVNQAADGQPLWRQGGDVWFWSPDHAVVVNAWRAIEQFVSVTGTSIQRQKCGGVRISANREQVLPLDDTLPTGQIRWGFLVLSPTTGEFEVDLKMIDAHIDELHKQLLEKKYSILAFIQTWNTYVGTFLSSNFGRASNSFGQGHVDAMLAAHQRIQRRIFPGTEKDGFGAASNIIEYLKTCIAERFGVTDIPDGYFFYPTNLGGLDLQSPFISLLQIRDSVLPSPERAFERMYRTERLLYSQFKASWVSETTRLRREKDNAAERCWKPESAHDRDNFMSLDEFVAHREYAATPLSVLLRDVFNELMKEPQEKGVLFDKTAAVASALEQLAAVGGQGGGMAAGTAPITPYWHQMKPYWRWVVTMYGPEIVERFGGMNIVDAGLLPMGMVGVFRQKRVTWSG